MVISQLYLTYISSPKAYRINRIFLISELAKELTNVIRDLIRLLLVDEVAHSLHDNNILKIWHASLEATFVDVVLYPRSVVCNV